MYQTASDPYCYKGTTVLKNRLGTRDQAVLDAYEAESTARRFRAALPSGRLTVSHYCAIHRHLFGKVYSWAGRFRTTRISKADSLFCYPEHIEAQMVTLFKGLRDERGFIGLGPDVFSARTAHFLAELNAIHAFREGNGRTQLAFFTLLAARAGHPTVTPNLRPQAILDAMIVSFTGDEKPLTSVIRSLISAA